MAVVKEGNVKWVDGLRGIASTLVVIKHITCAFFPYLLWPAPGPDEPPVLLERPYLRVLVQGRIGVAIFSFVTGYVCALKPIKNFRIGNQNFSLNSISWSAIRRVPRLVLPVLIILTASCVATQLGAFETANHCDGAGLPDTSPDRRDTWQEAVIALLRDMVRVWSHGESHYGAELWTMMPILKGAFWVYAYLLATAHVQTRYRMMIALGLTLFRYAANDPFFGMQFFFGAFMADLQQLPEGCGPAWTSISPKSRLAGLRMLTSAFFLVTGLFIGSLPDMHFEWQPWSQSLVDFLLSILPQNPDLPRFSSGLGLDLIVMGIHFSPSVRTILSSKPFLWLGRVSFAVYLLHNQLLRSVLCWMLYGFKIPAPVQDPDSGEWTAGPYLEFPGTGRLYAVLPVYFALVYGAGYLWIEYVDTWCARLTERICGAIKDDYDEKSGPLLLPIAHGNNEGERR